jgi:hypothetical protein
MKKPDLSHLVALRNELRNRRKSSPQQLKGVVLDFTTPAKLPMDVKKLIQYSAERGLLGYCLQLQHYKAFEVNQKAHAIFSQDQLTINNDIVNCAAELCAYLAGHEQFSPNRLHELILDIDTAFRPQQSGPTTTPKQQTTSSSSSYTPPIKPPVQPKTQPKVQKTTPPPVTSNPQYNRYQTPSYTPPPQPDKVGFIPYIIPRVVAVGVLGFVAGFIIGMLNTRGNPFADGWDAGLYSALIFAIITLVAGYGTWWIQNRHPGYQPPSSGEGVFPAFDQLPEHLPWVIGIGVLGIFGGLLGFMGAMGLLILVKFLLLFQRIK